MNDDKDVISLTLGAGITRDPATKMFTVAGPIGEVPDTASFSVEACSDMSGYQDGMVTFSFVEKTLTGTPMGLGNVAAGNMLSVTVQSDETTPTVAFATSSLTIDEGSTETVAILADTAYGPEVGSVMVGVSDDAMISLWQDDNMLEAGDDGMYAVDLSWAMPTPS